MTDYNREALTLQETLLSAKDELLRVYELGRQFPTVERYTEIQHNLTEAIREIGVWISNEPRLG